MAVLFTGKFENSDSDAVVLLEKTPFSEETLPQMLSAETSLVMEFNNEIYNQYTCQPQSRFNTLKGTIIYPATAKHLDKFSTQNVHFVRETPEDYKSITLPFVEEQSFSIQVCVKFVRLKSMLLLPFCPLMFESQTEQFLIKITQHCFGFSLLGFLYDWLKLSLTTQPILLLLYKTETKSQLYYADFSIIPFMNLINVHFWTYLNFQF